jgi:hypothetical protein
MFYVILVVRNPHFSNHFLKMPFTFVDGIFHACLQLNFMHRKRGHLDYIPTVILHCSIIFQASQPVKGLQRNDSFLPFRRSPFLLLFTRCALSFFFSGISIEFGNLAQPVLNIFL